MTKTLLKKSSLGLLMVVALSLSACAKKEGSATRVAGRSNGAVTGNGGVGTPNTPNTPNTCSPQQSNVGKIYGTTTNFESDVKSFVSATLDPQQLGSIGYAINSPTGIDFYGSFQFDSQGALVVQNSSMMIKIFDSYAVSTNGQAALVDPYVINFSQASSGQIQRNGSYASFVVTFKDEYGEITFNGSVNQGVASGTVTYRNYLAVSGYTPTAGTLGQFSAYSCALIK